jgi:SAM-dependent methyltransferase
MERVSSLRWPAKHKPTLNEWITQHVGTSYWYVGEPSPAPGKPLSQVSYDSLREEYLRLYGDEPAIGAATPTGFFEVIAPFTNLPSWKRWLDENPWATTPEYVASVVSAIRRKGFFDPLRGYAHPSLIAIDERNLRESVVFRGLNSRCRAVLRLIIDANLSDESVVYAPESVTALANLLREHFPNFIASEYLPTVSCRQKFPNTRHEDIQALSFEGSSIDAYVSCEIMEHIPSVPAAIREAARVLRPGGVFIATFPFRTVDQDTSVKATLENGQVRFLTEPEYHGNPIDPQGSLVFSIPAWDILDTVCASGFSNAEMVAITSRHFGIVADVPILVMRAAR